MHHGKPKISSPGDCSLTLVSSDPSTPRYWRVRALDHVVGEQVDLPTAPTTDEGISHLPPNFIGGELDLSRLPAPGGRRADRAASSPRRRPAPSASASASASAGPSPARSPAKPVLSCTPANPVEKGAWSATTRSPCRWPSTTTDHTTFPLVTTNAAAGHHLHRGRRSAATSRSSPGTRSPGAMAYRVYLALDPSYSNIAYVGDVLGTEWVPLLPAARQHRRPGLLLRRAGLHARSAAVPVPSRRCRSGSAARRSSRPVRRRAPRSAPTSTR